jgi:hypothetical protein
MRNGTLQQADASMEQQLKDGEDIGNNNGRQAFRFIRVLHWTFSFASTR